MFDPDTGFGDKFTTIMDLLAGRHTSQSNI